jgi:hypothetical protein
MVVPVAVRSRRRVLRRELIEDGQQLEHRLVAGVRKVDQARRRRTAAGADLAPAGEIRT